METEYQLITREIAHKGTAYLLIRRCKPEGVRELLRRAAGAAAGYGAKRLLAASLDSSAPLSEGQWEGLRLTHVHDMHLLEREMETCPPAGAVALVPGGGPGRGVADVIQCGLFPCAQCGRL